MKSQTQLPHPGRIAPSVSEPDSILTLITTLLGEIVIIDVMGL